MAEKLILVTGATGYIANRLIPRLLENDYRVRVLARRPDALAGRAWRSRVEIFKGDVTQPHGVAAALENVHSAYYLIHNMQIGRGYTRVEMEAARNFTFAAKHAGVEHIIYLGGLANPNDKHLAPHLRSRMETGATLRESGVPVTEFRTGVIAGPGSISFEMIRFMTEALPLTIGPTWLKNKTQPIAVENVIDYLTAALEVFDQQSHIFEVGGNEVTTYGNLMLRYARVRGLKRSLLLLPGIPLWFMAWGVGILTPAPSWMAYALLGGLSGDSVVQNNEARRVFPNVKLINFEEATTNALKRMFPSSIDRVWQSSKRAAVHINHEGFFIEDRCIEINASPESVYRVLTSLGGKHGWLYANGLWQLRGWMDKLLPHANPSPREALPKGAERGARGEGEGLKVGDALDYYRVEAMEPNRLLRLYSELRAPGDGWMEWQVEAHENGSLLTQTAFFAPRGLPGFLYWFLLSPAHRLVFRGLIQAIKRHSETQ
ncbi:MAG TPA: SDR family oxidoreductase [Anaerolineales bacterium]